MALLELHELTKRYGGLLAVKPYPCASRPVKFVP